MQQSQLFRFQGPVAGVDEAGRGPLAGPVVASAVILAPGNTIPGLDDSKKLTPGRRERLAVEIKDRAVAWSVAWCDAAEIDAVNILAATMLAMRRAILGLSVFPTAIQVDGNRLPSLACGAEAIVRGDSLVPAISAASILAKVTRDREMVELDAQYPGYGLAQHKGYPTKAHLEALAALGVSAIHRRTFAPVRCLIE